MTEKERNCLLRIAGELEELCRTSEKTKASKVGDTSEETYINPLGPMPDEEKLAQRAMEDMGIVDTNSLDTIYSEEEKEQQAKRAVEDMGIDYNSLPV